MMQDTATERARISEVCEELAAQTGDDRFARAAGVLKGKPAGRPAADDNAALAFAESLFDAGLAKSKNQACKRAASMYSTTGDKTDVIRARLVRKLRRK